MKSLTDAEYAGLRVVRKTRLAITIDIDDVLFPWYDRAHAACVLAGIDNGIVPVTWTPYDEYGCTAEQWWEALRVATFDGSLYTGEPFEGVVRSMWDLEHAGHFLNLVTARGTHSALDDEIREQIQYLTREWLADHFVPHDTLTFAHDKTLVPADVSVDDSLSNYDALDLAGHTPFLVDRPHNQDPGDDRRRVSSFTHFANIILGRDA